jgi:hypothetical protein
MSQDHIPGRLCQEYQNASSYDVAVSVSPRWPADVYAATVNGELRDLSALLILTNTEIASGMTLRQSMRSGTHRIT